MRRWPLTGAGVVVLLLVTGAIAAGMTRQDRVALAAGLTGAVVLGSSLCTALWAAWSLRTALRAEVVLPTMVEGWPTRSGLSLARPLGASVTLSWAAPAAAVTLEEEDGRLLERVVPRRRAEREAVVRDVEVGDVLGLVALRWTATVAARVRVRPDRGRLAQVPVWRGLQGGDTLPHPDGTPDGDPIDLRAYAAGDPVRHVVWSIYARTRQLVVRTPERAVAPVAEVAAWLVAGPGDDAAAGAADVAVAQGVLGGRWVLGADGVAGLARQAAVAEELLMRSGDAGEDVQGTGLAAFLAGLGAGRRALVFVPATDGRWVDRVAAAVVGSPVPVDVLVVGDGVDARRVGSLAARLAGARVVLVDRAAGTVTAPEAWSARRAGGGRG